MPERKIGLAAREILVVSRAMETVQLKYFILDNLDSVWSASNERLPWWLLGAHAASGMLWIFRQVIGEGY